MNRKYPDSNRDATQWKMIPDPPYAVVAQKLGTMPSLCFGRQA
ncbi:MAG: hypothetical protein SGI96_05170 [Bacteroidota bacterium]|nr:hypothetical protein [Bacteroidota bacterium]